MNKIMICATEATNNRPCTLADLVTVANNLFTMILTVIFPLILAGAIFYLAYSLLRNLDNPEGIAKVKSDAISVAKGTLILLGAWSIMRFALKLMGWKGNLSQPLGVIYEQSIVWIYSTTQQLIEYVTSPLLQTAHAAPFVDPINNPDVQGTLTGAINFLSILTAIVLVCALVYVGYRFIAYSDNPEQLGRTKKMLLIVLIAGIVLFSTKFIINTLTDTFAGLDRQLDNSSNNNSNTNKP